MNSEKVLLVDGKRGGHEYLLVPGDGVGVMNIVCLAFVLLVTSLTFLTRLSRETVRFIMCNGHLVQRSEVAASGPQMAANQIVVRDGWVQEGPPSQTITAAYMVIENHMSNDISLQSASTEVAQVVELHKMEVIDGMMKMRRCESIDIPGGGKTELKPGGYHLMVIGLKNALKQDDNVTIILQFSHDIRKTITIPVKARDAMVKEH